MPRPPLGDKPMTNAERQARYRGARVAAGPVVRYRRPADHRSRAQRWRDAVNVLLALQAEYRAWLEALPDNLQDGATAQALQAIEDLDLDELATIETPRGFGRD
jgi:N-acetyl-gamma-glutamylphosphate reductase